MARLCVPASKSVSCIADDREKSSASAKLWRCPSAPFVSENDACRLLPSWREALAEKPPVRPAFRLNDENPSARPSELENGWNRLCVKRWSR